MSNHYVYLQEFNSVVQPTMQTQRMLVHSGSRKDLNGCPISVPISLLNETWAKINHGQSLAQLHSRGGLGVLEMLDNIYGRKLSQRKETQEDLIELESIILSRIPRYELIGQHSFKDRQELIEGKDFTWYYPNKVGEPSMVALVIPEKFKTPPVFVAIPTQGKQTGDEKRAYWYTDTEFPGIKLRLNGIMEFITRRHLPISKEQEQELLKGIGYWAMHIVKQATHPASDADNQNENKELI